MIRRIPLPSIGTGLASIRYRNAQRRRSSGASLTFPNNERFLFESAGFGTNREG